LPEIEFPPQRFIIEWWLPEHLPELHLHLTGGPESDEGVVRASMVEYREH
jgi:hypothetical protein